MADTSINPPWPESDLEKVSKKDLVTFLQASGSNTFLKRHGIGGKPANVIKSSAKPKLDAAYKDLFVCKEFRTAADDAEKDASAAPQAAAEAPKEESPVVAEEPAEKEPVKYTKLVTKKGDKVTFPKKGEKVTCKFKGSCKSTGKVFQDITGKRDKPLEFQVGLGKVIRGWDEVMMTMTKGEKATVTIEPDWAYGKKGKPEAGIPANETLIFEIELINVG